MSKYIPMACIQCETVGAITTTKNGYRCEECGAVWAKDKKPAAKKAAPKPG